MSINQIFDQSKASLGANQKALAVTSHNISNANTEGYSRQRVEMEARAPYGLGKVRVGNGVNVNAVTRASSTFVARRLEALNSQVGKSENYSGVLHQIEDIFVDDAEKGLNKSFSDFFNDVRNLSSQPNSTAMRAGVVESAKTLSTKFRSIQGSLDGIRNDIDGRITVTVDKINSLSQRIADLNRQIQTIEGSQGIANDEKDMRDLNLKELSTLVDINVMENDNGSITVSSGRMGDLVSGVDAYKVSAVRNTTPGGYFDGAMQVALKSSTGESVTVVSDFVKGGELGAYLKARDETLAGVAKNLDSLAFNFSKQVNDLHQGGFTLNGQQGGNIFDVGGDEKRAASKIAVTDELMRSPGMLAAGMTRNAPGDNRALLKLADLENSKVLNGESSFADFAGQMIAKIGIESRGAEETLQNQKGILTQIENLREQESGVSLDEEALNMVRFQKAFDASAKVIQVADSMLETVLNLKRF
ncbi:MAG: flagellar hook-associated protein FlgK [Proteobacteria bacterium]|nr:flagellar hook-associated protein FlgK [Pseudomonadota bacterium]